MDKKGNCTVCKSKCVWSNHSNLPYKFEEQEIIISKTFDDLKKKYSDSEKAANEVRLIRKRME